MFAAMDDVAGKAAETEREFPAQIKKSADREEQCAENKERSAEFAERVHGKEFRGNEVEK